MANAIVNCSGKIWLFWMDVWDGEIISDTIQQITIKFTHNVTKQHALITTVYARCSALERLELWEDIRWIANACFVPWVIGGDFNVVLNDSEKLGGLPVCQMETTDFAHCISDSGLIEFPFSGSLYTWWNGRTGEDSIFERLDRVLGNEAFWSECNNSEVTYLIRDGSDHAPLHVVCKSEHPRIKKPFRFLNFWCNHHSFLDVVRKTWEETVEGTPFKILHEKLKNKSTYGNIFQKVATLEDVVKVKELQLELDPSEENRAEMRRVATDLRKYQKYEEDLWKQKANLHWFKEGDRNTKIFHAYINGRRKRLRLQNI
ncbi:hypothetical protein H5410_028457 [Solanum commersonii]|uniref:Endonuclease/exonuclease/phosphatase domain-containing protein n=1 Tax=Solanum commersonii TaxID=4109 RepID=A0A9J5Z431_SOLCO|nr:hypothetical protein H5410_028457 [Solanum commersonii]